ncbi:S-adenosyl-l-methionine hydroxide adenosyltransferase family protein [Embleya sp. NBC_00896]|uniref:SAM hydrolase/SAM-dependent halogenase family protein n=1 Tax=Embleya sp. NBC_00896 TaxID=2975961 RepID=UPI003862D860|nr:SAM-dependent chlorinase/fluorinase [Embleya sp. NBC_00896]
MAASRRITFLTDYGLADGFVAACHGVLATIAPAVPVVDVSHLVPPGDVRRGALVLAQTLPWFPAGSVHIAVVDPGVGTARRPIVVRAGEHLLVGPDNGLLMWAARDLGGVDEVREITNGALTLGQVSRTFHGRDVFAPVAAHLALGTPAAEVGPAVPDPIRLPEPVPGEILTVDHFGNVQLAHTIAEFGAAAALRIEVGDRAYAIPLRGTFGDVPSGELVGYEDSAGLLAISVNGGDAARLLGVRAGDRIHVSPSC